MIIHTIDLMGQLDKDINTFNMCIREQYGYYFPELVKIVPDNHMYAKVAQVIKNKKSIASRIDYFLDVPTNVFREKLRQQVEDRLKFFKTGEIPKRNIDVMKAVSEESLVCMERESTVSLKKKKRRQKKEIFNVLQNGQENVNTSRMAISNTWTHPMFQGRKRSQNHVMTE